uniref:Grh/CP2 DB domain-containing protein n=1 Tax=Timema douglasi TaxID=61478 RepID=A0A7R8VCR1_TIMDO|nr:unnamed protein product [Timema douglasi]
MGSYLLTCIFYGAALRAIFVKRRRDVFDLAKEMDETGGMEWECGGGGRMSAWQVDDIPDLDGSLSGLGVDLSGYTMNEGLLALPSLTIFKQEAPSPSSHNDNVPTNIELDSNDVNKNSQLHHILQHQSGQYGNSVVTTIPPQQQTQLDNTVSQGVVSSSSPVTNMTISSVATSTTSPGQHNIDCRFQYVLAAATSTATKVNEETLTYLNQGQSYEIKLKKLGELSAYRGKILKSVIRICFHERRLQYMEKEQMAAWQASRPGERILEVDVPLSYGLYDVSQDRHNLNTVKFLWDPTKEVGVYVKVNCISTEFTPKRHGGEKGVTFKIQVETYFNGEDSGKHLHSAACQIKVFKLKGADRKHKQDRERILKRPLCEQDKFQPSYDCTVLNDREYENHLGGDNLSTTDCNSNPYRPVIGSPVYFENDTLDHSITKIPVESQFFSSVAVTSVTSSVKTAVSTPPEIM